MIYTLSVNEDYFDLYQSICTQLEESGIELTGAEYGAGILKFHVDITIPSNILAATNLVLE